jgi:hypothetical protein
MLRWKNKSVLPPMALLIINYLSFLLATRGEKRLMKSRCWLREADLYLKRGDDSLKNYNRVSFSLFIYLFLVFSFLCVHLFLYLFFNLDRGHTVWPRFFLFLFINRGDRTHLGQSRFFPNISRSS